MSNPATRSDRPLHGLLRDIDSTRIVLSGLVLAVDALSERSSTVEDAAGRISAICTLSGIMTDQLDKLTEAVRDALVIEHSGRRT